MVGIGARLNKIFQKQSITTGMFGVLYGSCLTVAPMVLVIGVLLLLEYLLGFDSLDYYTRELFSCTILYIFIFSLLTASPFNSVLSKYMQDAIFEERYQDILPCYYFGLVLNLTLTCLLGIPFCLWEHFMGGVPVAYVFTGFCGYISLTLVFYSMLYLSICKDYGRISLFFLVGMLISFILALVLYFLAGWETTRAMLLAMTVGFFLIAVLLRPAVFCGEQQPVSAGAEVLRAVLASGGHQLSVHPGAVYPQLCLLDHRHAHGGGQQLCMQPALRHGLLSGHVHQHLRHGHFYRPCRDVFSRAL